MQKKHCQILLELVFLLFVGLGDSSTWCELDEEGPDSFVVVCGSMHSVDALSTGAALSGGMAGDIMDGEFDKSSVPSGSVGVEQFGPNMSIEEFGSVTENAWYNGYCGWLLHSCGSVHSTNAPSTGRVCTPAPLEGGAAQYK